LVERKVPGDLSQKYTGGEFDYGVDRGEGMNLLGRFLRWFLNSMGEIFGFDVSPAVLLVLEYIIYSLMGCLALYLLIRMFVRGGFSSLFTKKAPSILEVALCERHIEAIDLDALLEGALRQGDYRLAVRYRFLMLLKQLSQREVIQWHFDKTNMDYLREIPPSPLRQEFQKATYLFDHIWYGQQPIDGPGYHQAEHRFDSLNRLIP